MNVTGGFGVTPLGTAFLWKRENLAKLLRTHGTRVHDIGEFDGCLFVVLARGSNVAIFKAFLTMDNDLNETCTSCGTALHAIIRGELYHESLNDYVDIIDTVLEKAPNLLFERVDEELPLEKARRAGDGIAFYTIFRKLLSLEPTIERAPVVPAQLLRELVLYQSACFVPDLMLYVLEMLGDTIPLDQLRSFALEAIQDPDERIRDQGERLLEYSQLSRRCSARPPEGLLRAAVSNEDLAGATYLIHRWPYSNARQELDEACDMAKTAKEYLLDCK